MMADEFFKEFSDLRNIGLGLVVLLFMIFLPEGVAGAIESVCKPLPANRLHPTHRTAVGRARRRDSAAPK